MQAIAREFNHPETVFVFPPEIRRTGRGCASLRRRANCRSPAIRPSGPQCCSRCATAAARAANSCWRSRSGRCDACSRRSAGERGTRASSCRSCRPRRTRADATALAAGLALRRKISASTRCRPSRWSGRQSFHLRAGLPGLARIGPLPPRRRQVRGGLRRGRRRPSLLRRNAEPGRQFHARMFAPAWASAKIRDRLGRGGVCRRDRRAASRRRRACDRHRAGLRDGPAEPDRLAIVVAAGKLRFGHDRRRRRHRHRRRHRGMMLCRQRSIVPP